jgi:hypothetical protein
MFLDGYNRIVTQGNAAWLKQPPETEWEEEFVVRRGTHLTAIPPSSRAGERPRAIPRVARPAGGPLNPSYLRSP